MKKNKGFTLIELLAVIVILGILLSISIVAVNNINKNQKKENRINVINSILTGAKEYVANNKDVLDSIPASVSLDELIDGNYVDFDKNKFPEFAGSSVDINFCGDELGVKLIYYFEGYNDCGCETQEERVSEKICK